MMCALQWLPIVSLFIQFCSGIISSSTEYPTEVVFMLLAQTLTTFSVILDGALNSISSNLKRFVLDWVYV
jgi:hypothetical protein